MTRCVQAVVTGKVQGVYFRAFTQEEAERLGLVGWVRNLPTGQVETLFCGPSTQVEAMIDWLSIGSPHSIVTEVTVKDMSCAEQLSNFSIRY